MRLIRHIHLWSRRLSHIILYCNSEREICIVMPRPNKPIRGLTTSLQAGCKSKRRFNNRLAALKAAENQMLIDISLRLSVYKCNYCPGWHLTRQAKSTN